MSPASDKLMSQLLWSGGGSASVERPREEAAGSASHYQSYRKDRRHQNIETKTVATVMELSDLPARDVWQDSELTIKFPRFLSSQHC